MMFRVCCPLRLNEIHVPLHFFWLSFEWSIRASALCHDMFFMCQVFIWHIKIGRTCRESKMSFQLQLLIFHPTPSRGPALIWPMPSNRLWANCWNRFVSSTVRFKFVQVTLETLTEMEDALEDQQLVAETVRHLQHLRYSYGHLSVITGYKWDYTFYKWGYKYL